MAVEEAETLLSESSAQRESFNILIENLKSLSQSLINRCPGIFDERLNSGLRRLIDNIAETSLAQFSFSHLRKLLITQYFLQNKIEKSQRSHPHKKTHFLKILNNYSTIGVAFTLTFRRKKEHLCFERLFKTLQALLPSIIEVPGSEITWSHPDHPYLFCYFEINKLRGTKLSKDDIVKLEEKLGERLPFCITSMTPKVFWPYNEEDSFRQLQLLLQEIHHKNDLPQVSIHFKEQQTNSLEFLIQVALTTDDYFSLNQHVQEKLPDDVNFTLYLDKKINKPFPLQTWIFSLSLPHTLFYENETINLLYARRKIAKYVEHLIGPYRDFNGGLFEKYQENFETIRTALSEKIPLFSLFAEKAFYSLKPIEERFSISVMLAESLFNGLSELIKSSNNFSFIRKEKGSFFIKTQNIKDLKSLKILHMNENKRFISCEVELMGFYYFCALNAPSSYIDQIEHSLHHKILNFKSLKTLKLNFREGEPPSLHPHHSARDLRCQILCKMLFEGLTRIDSHGNAALAGASSFIQTNNTTFVFKIRPHSWSNGEKVTAYNYINSWKDALRKNIARPDLFFIIKNASNYHKGDHQIGLSAPDPLTLKVELERPDPSFLKRVAQPIFFPTFSITAEPRWFNGPYLLHAKNKKGLTLEKNPYYWDCNSIFFKEIAIHWNSENQEHQNSHWKGDPLDPLSSDNVKRAYNTGCLKQQLVKRFFIIYFNTESELLKSSKIRQALSAVLTSSTICTEIFPYNKPLQHPFLFPKDKKEESLTIEAAQELFQEGLKELPVKANFLTNITFSYPNITNRELLAQYVKKTWEETFNIQVKLHSLAWNAFNQNLDKGNFDCGGCFENLIIDDPQEFLERFAIPNISRWINCKYQKLIALIHCENSADLRLSYSEKAEDLLFEEAPFVPICMQRFNFIPHPFLKDYVFDHSGCIDFRWASLNQNILN